MPLHETEDPATLSLLREVQQDFVIFYSSRDEGGELWCPDCRAVDELIQSAFGPDTGHSGLVVFVGQRSEWKSPSNPFRGNPWNVQSVPTIIRIRDGARLVDTDIRHSLAAFLQE
ncbi:hypothetical protein BKA93DRAFT_727092 [Sparassis latifolia]